MYGPGSSLLAFEDELQPENVSKMWSRFSLAHQERDNNLQAEILRYGILFHVLLEFSGIYV